MRVIYSFFIVFIFVLGLMLLSSCASNKPSNTLPIAKPTKEYKIVDVVCMGWVGFNTTTGILISTDRELGIKIDVNGDIKVLNYNKCWVRDTGKRIKHEVY